MQFRLQNGVTSYKTRREEGSFKPFAVCTQRSAYSLRYRAFFYYFWPNRGSARVLTTGDDFAGTKSDGRTIQTRSCEAMQCHALVVCLA